MAISPTYLPQISQIPAESACPDLCCSPQFSTSISIPNSSFPTPNCTYTFSAKERDPETGLSYFGSRYYSSDLSIWLSVDPQAWKYPLLSPYVYCADNPIKLVDPDGEDYEVVIDDQSKTITIKATYYVTKDTREGMKMAFNYFTCQEQNLSYAMGNGENYSVKFDLSIAGEYDTWEQAYDAVNSSGVNYANVCRSGKTQNAINGVPAAGQTEIGRVITIKQDCVLQYRTFAHEIGHTLGMGEWSSELMKSGGNQFESGLFSDFFQQTMRRTNRSIAPDDISSPYAKTEKTNWGNVGTGFFLTK